MSDGSDIVFYALETAKISGAQDASATFSRTDTLKLSWSGNVDNIVKSCRSSFYIALYVDGKCGHFSTVDCRKDHLADFIRQGIEMTRFMASDPAYGLADPMRYENYAGKDLQLYDDKIAALTRESIAADCNQFRETAFLNKKFRITDVSTSFTSSIYHSFDATTNGFAGTVKGSAAVRDCTITASVDGMRRKGYARTKARHLEDLAAYTAAADEAAEQIARKIHRKKLPSGRRTMILDRRAALDFICHYIAALDGSALIGCRSYFKDKIGERMASDVFDLRDEPHIVRGLHSRLYDDECMSVSPSVVFDHGVLRQFYLDNYSARKLGLKATTGRPVCPVLTPGKRSLAAMIGDVSDGIYVIGFRGGSMHSLSGDFSFSIVGTAIENGELTANVHEMVITGNILDVMHRLIEAGCDPHPDESGYDPPLRAYGRVPSLRFDDVAFSGT